MRTRVVGVAGAEDDWPSAVKSRLPGLRIRQEHVAQSPVLQPSVDLSCSEPLNSRMTATLQLYNTLTRAREPFAPLDWQGKRVLFYTCGPTVYDYAHIGNFRSFLNADLLRRTLDLLGYEVRHVMNITDVGHMTDDEVADGGGEDKMQQAARRIREAKKAGTLPEDADDIDPGDPYAIAKFYTDAFIEDARTLGIKVIDEADDDPSLLPRPTQYIDQMRALVNRLIESEHAYAAGDAIYFDVQSFPQYGKLSGNTLSHLRAGAGGRVDETNQSAKKHPADFLLWKDDPSHLMKWVSPLGSDRPQGYPGWHLECSVMAQALLGEVIDIHSGGEDNIFPHHECEIAQSCSASGREMFSRFWFHTRFLLVEGEKMSKRKGNFFTVRDLLARGGSPAAIRLALTSTHYRDNANFTMQELQNAQRQIDRWFRLRDELHNELHERAAASSEPANADRGAPGTALGAFTDALADDLNISGAIGALNRGVSDSVASSGDAASALAALDTMLDTLGVLHLAREGHAAIDEDHAAVIETRIAERNAARASKDFATADRIRDELRDMGVEIMDSAEGTTWERVVQ